MSIRQCLILGWMMAGLQVISAGQNQPSQNTSTQSPSDGGARTAPAAPLSAKRTSRPALGIEPSGEAEGSG